jgi:non-homologous end joining protein Ku
LIEKVRTGAKQIGGKTTTRKPATDVIDLVTVLQKSIAEAGSKVKGKKAGSEKRKTKAA